MTYTVGDQHVDAGRHSGFSERRELMKPNRISVKNKTVFIEKAVKAHSDLNIFYAIIALMESSLVSPDCYGAESMVVRICRRETQKCLVRYDAALDALSRSSEVKT